MHRCLLISEILCNILEFIQQYEGPLNKKDGCKEKLGKQTLASLAQTCHALSSPALDQLWMCLENLDPLIKLLPRSLWENPICYTITVVRMIRTKKHQWLPFRQYAKRVRSLRSFFYRIHPWDQHVIVTALVRSRKVTLPLLPNLIKLKWDDPYSVSESTTALSLVKFFASPKLTSLSLNFLSRWPSKPAKLAALYDLPRLCPNITSFTAILDSSNTKLDAVALCLVDIIRRWPHLQVLETSVLCPSITTALASKPAVHTLNFATSFFHNHNIGSVPASIQTLTLGTYGTQECLLCLKTLQGTPVRLHLRIHWYRLCWSEMGTIFQELSERLDCAQLRFLTVELTSPGSCRHPGSSSLLTEHLFSPLHSFSALHTLDLSSFCTSHLVDAAYERIVAPWPELRCLKLGTTDAYREKPAASVGAVIAVLRSCPHLQTLHIVFNGIIPPPCPTMNEEETNGRVEDGKDERAEIGQVIRWGVSNAHITRIHVGHSPIGLNMDQLKGLATCLGSVMPRLRTIQFDGEMSGPTERWRMVQHMLIEGTQFGVSSLI